MVDRVKGVEKVTDNPFLNLYNFDVEKRNGKTGKYYVASRKKDPTQLKAATHKNTSDGVIIYSVYGEKKDKIVLIKQFRYPINAYVYEFPAGLVEPGEEMAQAGIREIYEETGLVFEPKVTEGAYKTIFYDSWYDRRKLRNNLRLLQWNTNKRARGRIRGYRDCISRP